MILTEETWEKIKEYFTVEDKAQLNAAICGQSICPKGFILDETKLSLTLLRRIRDAKQGLKLL